MKTTALVPVLLVFGLLPLGAQAQISPLQKRMRERPSQTTQLMKAVSAKPATSGFAVATIRRSYWDGSAWTLESETRNTFSGQRRMESAQYDVSGPTPVPQFRTNYDLYGNVLTFDQWDPDSRTYIPFERYTYTLVFDAVRNRYATEQMIREVYYGTWENAERYSFTIASDNSGGLHIVGGTNEYWEGTAWRASMRFTLSETGSDVVESTQVRLGTNWIDSERTTYHDQTITGLNDLLIELSSEFEDLFDLNLSFLMFPDVTSEFWTGTRWTNIYRQFADSFHAPTGRPTSVRYQEWNGAAWIDESRQEVTYAEAAGEFRPSTSTLIDFDEGQAFTFLSETYAYDGSGLLVTAEQQTNFGFGLENFLRVEYTWTALSVGSEETPSISSAHALEPAYPNPFSASTTLTYRLASSDDVQVRVYDLLGREVKALVAAPQAPGLHRVEFDAASLPSGLYVVRLATTAGVLSGTVTLVR